MTTIAYDGETLATDSQMTGIYVDSAQVKKVFQLKSHTEYIVCAIAGATRCCEPFIEWLEDGAKRDGWPFVDEDFTAVCITKDGSVFEYESQPLRVRVGVPYAAGSGGSFAAGALLAGATSEQAIEISKKLDAYSGGETQVFKI